MISQLKFKAVEQVTVPSDVPTCKTNLFKWLSAAVDELNKDGTGILHCWTKTKLLRAWEGPVQAEAARRAEELFPNMSNGDFLPADFKEDEEAGFSSWDSPSPSRKATTSGWTMCPGKRSRKRPHSSEAVWPQARCRGVQVVQAFTS